MSFGRSRAHGLDSGGGGHDDLNITPLLDVLSCLIPFLIFSVVMTKINIVDVGISRPVAATSASSSTQPFNLMLKVSPTKAEVVLNGKSLKQVSISDADTKWLDELRMVLVDLKKKNPNEYRIRIEPQGQVELQLLMVLMDGARKLKPSDGDIITKDPSGKPVKLQFLFPNVVLRGVYS